MYKFIAIDLDGTLLNSYGEISNENKEALNKAIDKGVQIVLTSGRISKAIEYISNQIGRNNYLISGNGTTIYDIKNDIEIYNKCMSKETVLKIIEICEENSIYYSVFGENSIITKSLGYNVLVYNSENYKKSPDMKTKINVIPNVYKYIKNSKQNRFSKITICDSSKIIFKGILRKLKEIKNIEVLDVAHMSRKKIRKGTEQTELQYFYTDITNKDVNKWNAIKFLIDNLGISPGEVLTIGDNSNDKEMIINAGLGIAMGNSAPHIKEIADDVVGSNDNNGVAEALYKYVI